MNAQFVRRSHCVRARVLAAAVCSLALLAASPHRTLWQHWKYSRAIVLPATKSPRLVTLNVPIELYVHAAPFLADIRIIDETGADVPYLLRGCNPVENSPSSTAVASIQKSFFPGHYTQFVLDLGDLPAFHNGVQIDTLQSDFMEWVEVAASDDAHSWRVIEPREPVFRFSRQGRWGTTLVTFPPANARYLRVWVLDGEKQFPLTSAFVANSLAAPSKREQLPIQLSGTRPITPGDSAWSADLGVEDLPLREVRFSVGPGDFMRDVSVLSSNDNQRWFCLGSGEIYRFAREKRQWQRLSVPLGIPARYVRVEIANRTDPPLPAVVPELYIAPEHVLFEQSPGKVYRLLYGNIAATAPWYQAARLLIERVGDSALVAQVGPEQANPDWLDPRPWSEKHNSVMWMGAALAVLLMVYAAVQSLRRSTGPAPQDHDP